MNIQNAIEKANQLLKKNNIKSAMLDSEILMSKVIKKDRKYVILNLDKKLKRKDQLKFENLVISRSSGKPIAYLIGEKDFWKYNFIVNEKTLIPRPDTEIIIDNILKLTKLKNLV